MTDQTSYIHSLPKSTQVISIVSLQAKIKLKTEEIKNHMMRGDEKWKSLMKIVYQTNLWKVLCSFKKTDYKMTWF